ncbi:hypothetical protein BGX23_006897 [Mortierella sp. AD031]|nr:hypothetical protein BGX23_006897 [Mortierella sp. AD031]KAG0206844.1 hypothetical protein BGX33_007197 [Mortierella sp. NVP41]
MADINDNDNNNNEDNPTASSSSVARDRSSSSLGDNQGNRTSLSSLRIGFARAVRLDNTSQRSVAPTSPKLTYRPRAPPVALTIPEILEWIFAYLTSQKQRFLVGQVCHQWRAVALRLLTATDDYLPLATSFADAIAGMDGGWERPLASPADGVTFDPVVGLVRWTLGWNGDDCQALLETAPGRGRRILGFALSSIDANTISRNDAAVCR